MGRWAVDLVAVALTAVGVTAGGACRSPDEIRPPPKVFPYIETPLPCSTTAYHKYTTGLRSLMTQIRFDMEPQDMPALEASLPCKLGPIETGISEIADVGTNDRSWYTPERATRHRSCEHHHGLLDASFLVDLGDPDRITVYGVLGLD